MHFKYDPTSVTTKRLTDEIAIDHDADGKMAGLELLDTSKYVFKKPIDWRVAA